MKSKLSRLISPRFVFLTLSILVLLAFSLSPMTRKRMGIFDGGQWFLDSYAVLAANDAHRAGIDPSAPNPYDPLFRTHKYSDWWFGLGKLGLTRDDNFLVGGLWVLAFFAVLFTTIKPSSFPEAVWLAILVSSPSVLLGINRANNDLVVFSLLGLALMALRRDSNLRVAIAIGLVALGTGLKFYPIVAVAAFIFVRPKRILGVTLGATLVTLAALAMVGSQVGRGSFGIDPNPYRIGAQMIFQDAGISESRAPLVSGLFFVVMVLLAIRFGWTRENAEDRDVSEPRRMMTMGSVVLVACFLLGINAAYRWIFVLWAAPWLWSHRRTYPAARWGVWLLPFCLWHDAILCLAVNRWFRTAAITQPKEIGILWRAITEPFTWCLMLLLTGWLLNSLAQTAREIWNVPRSPPLVNASPRR